MEQSPSYFVQMMHVGEEEILNLAIGTSVSNQRKECVREKVRFIVVVFLLESASTGSFQVPVGITLSSGVRLTFTEKPTIFLLLHDSRI